MTKFSIKVNDLARYLEISKATIYNYRNQSSQRFPTTHEIAVNLFELHKTEANKDSSIKILQKKYADVLKERNNIIKAIEQGLLRIPQKSVYANWKQY